MAIFLPEGGPKALLLKLSLCDTITSQKVGAFANEDKNKHTRPCLDAVEWRRKAHQIPTTHTRAHKMLKCVACPSLLGFTTGTDEQTRAAGDNIPKKNLSEIQLQMLFWIGGVGQTHNINREL